MTSGASPSPQNPPRLSWLTPSRRRFIKRWVYPAAVIASIAAVIWWIEYRPEGGGGHPADRYGVVDLPAAMVTEGGNVEAAVGALAPDFLLERAGSGELRLSEYRGRPVVLNFWATWCPPCTREIPQLVAAYGRYRDNGLVIIGVNLQEGKAVVRPFIEDFGIEFPIVIDRSGRVAGKYRVGGIGTDRGLPTTFFIDGEGVIRSVYTGPFLETRRETEVQEAIGRDELDKRIAEILGEGP
jgi:peroxiredoxin